MSETPTAKGFPTVEIIKYIPGKPLVLPPHHSSFLVRFVFPIFPCPHNFSKICGQVSSIVLHPFSSMVEGEIPIKERRDVYELCSSKN